MKNIITILAVILFSFGSFSQKRNKYDINTPKITGENGENLWIDQDLSFKEKHLYSEFYIDSISKEPYTGILTINYNGNSIDSINVIQGYKSGISVNYNLKDSIVLKNFYYLDQGNLTFIARSYPVRIKKYTTKNKYNYIWVRFFSDEKYIQIHAVRKKNFIEVTVKEDKEKIKFRIDDIQKIYDILLKYSEGVHISQLLRINNVLNKFEIKRNML